MRWTAARIAEATSGAVRPPAGRDTRLESLAIDSRGLSPGALFVAVRAERDGHDFIADAVEAGAAGVLAESGRAAGAPVAIEVHDTAVALLAVGTAARSRLTGPVVGITGSVGKTSTKDLAAAALAGARRVAASEASFNNQLGVPLTLANAPDDTEVAVVEMGSRGVGHIRALCAVARPTIGVVTAIAAVHTETFGTVDTVARAKAELVEALPPSGTAILNGDDRRVAAMAAASAAPVLTWSAAGAASADVAATEVRLDELLRPRFVLRSPWGSASVRLDARGVHQVGNALAGAAVALACGVDLEVACAGLGRGRLSRWRMEVVTAPSGVVVVNDAYNANPTSTAAALRSLAALPATRRVAVLGTMAELGDGAAAEHRKVAALAADLGIEVVAVGTRWYGPEPVPDVTAAVAALGPLTSGVAVLVKGSRVAGLERLAVMLAET